MRIPRLGSRGDDARLLQRELSCGGFAVGVTKLYDEATLAAVRTLQTKSGIAADGTCVEAGSITRGKTYAGWTQYGAVWCAETESQWINVT